MHTHIFPLRVTPVGLSMSWSVPILSAVPSTCRCGQSAPAYEHPPVEFPERRKVPANV